VIGRDFSLKAIKADRKRAREVAAVASRAAGAGWWRALIVTNRDWPTQSGQLSRRRADIAHFNAVRG
jgi:hypothetical protein